jgi:hypothetical protein
MERVLYRISKRWLIENIILEAISEINEFLIPFQMDFTFH